MEIGNEKHNKVTNKRSSLGSKQQGQWRAVCGADQRFYFVNLETKASQWLPPTELWSSKFGLPYGWEAGLSKNNIKYYINHANKTSTLEDPRSEADQASTHLQMAAMRSRKIQIKRDSSLGFGFVAGSEKPVVIRSVISGGPSHGKLFSNDQILKVNGKDVSDVPQERVINLIKSCSDELEIHVVSSEDLQDAKNQGPRRSSLMSRATRERRRSSPVNVRFADDMVQYIGPAEQARRGSLPVLPNVLKVYLENGQTRSFHYNQKTTVQEIFTALGPKLDIKAMEHFCLVLSGPRKNQLSLLQNHEKVSEIYLNRNCSRSSWVCKLRICFFPRDPDELLQKDSVAFDYLYEQISKDIVEGLFEIDLRYDLAIKLAALHMQQKATEAKNKMPTKITVKSVEKDFDGLEQFVPENIINGVKLKDLRKVLEQQIKFNQSLAGLGQRYLTSNECKQQYLKLASELVSFGGKYFNVILFSHDSGTGSDKNKLRKARQQEVTILASPKYGLSQMVKGKINVLCQLADLEQISEFSISFHAEGKRLLTISVVDNKDLVLLMKPLDSMDLVTFIIGYQKLWNNTTAKLKIEGERKEPLAPLTDNDIPPYASLHRVIPDTWSYPSFLQVPGSNSEHHFYLDLSKDPPVYTKSSAESTNVPSMDADNSHIAVKRSSEEINSSDSGEEEGASPDSGKRIKVDDSRDFSNFEFDDDMEMEDSPSKARTLYSIAEENQINNKDNEEPVEDDYISQLALAEEIWRKNRNESLSGEALIVESPSESATESQDVRTDNINEDLNVSETATADGMKNEKLDTTVVSDKDSETEIESFHVEKDATDDEIGVKPNGEDKFDENNENKEDDKEIKGIQSGKNVHTSKKDIVMEDKLENKNADRFLDINDIDFDDQPETSSVGSLDLLADFSFTGEITPGENESSVKIQNEDVLMYGDDKVQGDDDDDDDDGNDVDNHNDSSAFKKELSKQNTDFSSNFDSKPEEQTKNNEIFNQVDEARNSNQEIIFEDTFDNLSSEKLKYFDKKEKLDELGKTDFGGTTLEERNSPDKSQNEENLPWKENCGEDFTQSFQNSSVNKNSKDDDQDNENQKYLNAIDEDEGGVQLETYKQKDSIIELKRKPIQDETKDSNNGDLPMSDNSEDGVHCYERKDDDQDKNQKYLNAIDEDEGEVKLVSYKQKDSIIELKRRPIPDETKDSKNGDLPVSDNSEDGVHYYERKNSESSSLTSQSSWQFVNVTGTDSKHREGSLSGNERQQNDSYFKARSCSSDDVGSLDEEIGLENLAGTNDTNTLEENTDFHSQNNLNGADKSRSNEEYKDQSSTSSLSNEFNGGKENETGDSATDIRDEISASVTHNDVNDNNSSIEDPTNAKRKSSLVLFLENDPGESEDTPENINKVSSEKNGDTFLNKEEIDFLELSLMDWIIPPPPGSTEKLLDSDISIASPPPSSPGFRSVSSPPVELNDDIFINEFEIDGLILPPPPMGSSFNSVIRIVSPPPLQLNKPNRKKDTKQPTTNYKVDINTSVESSRQKLVNLTLEDSRTVDESVAVSSAQNRSSESSGSVMTDDYNSESMISCYSLSNDSQRTSEDEFYDEDRNEVFGDYEGHSIGNIGNVTLFGSEEPSIRTKELEKSSLYPNVVPSSTKKSQHSEEIENKIQQERSKDLDNKTGDYEIVSRVEGRRYKDPKAYNQKPLKEKLGIDMLTNGLPYEKDYDCLDELDIIKVNNISSFNEATDYAKPTVPDLSRQRNVTMSWRKNGKGVTEKIDYHHTVDNTTSNNQNLETALVEPNYEERYVQNRTNCFDKPLKTGKPVETNRNKKPHSPNLSSKMQFDSEQRQTLNNDDEKIARQGVRSVVLHEKKPKPLSNPSVQLSNIDNLPKTQSTSEVLPSSYPLKKYEEKSSPGKTEIHHPSSDGSLESESATDHSPRFQRKTQTRRIRGAKIPTQKLKDTFVVDGDGDLSSSDESGGNVDDSGPVRFDHDGKHNGELLLDDGSIDLEKSCLSAKTDTINLTERLTLRLQGCVDDCQNSVLKPSFLPYAINTKWKDGVRDNADYFASDVKRLNKNVQEMNNEIITTLKASQETLQSLVSSFVIASTSQHRISLYSVRMLAGILNDVISLYNDIISKTEEAVRLYPNKSKLRSVSEKTTSMTALIASLNRTLKRL